MTEPPRLRIRRTTANDVRVLIDALLPPHAVARMVGDPAGAPARPEELRAGRRFGFGGARLVEPGQPPPEEPVPRRVRHRTRSLLR